MNCNPNAIACQIEMIRNSLDNPSGIQWVSAIGSVLAVAVAVWAAVRSNTLAREAQSREDKRVADAVAAADLAARFETGRPDAVKARKWTEALIRAGQLDPSMSGSPLTASMPTIPFPPPPFPVDPVLSDRLAKRVRMIPDSTLAERLSWLVRAVINPQAYSPEPALTNFPFFQMMCLGYIADDLDRFIRRDNTVDQAAEALAGNIADRFYGQSTTASTTGDAPTK